MELTFVNYQTRAGRNVHVAQIDHAKIAKKNFSGATNIYNRNGDKTFLLMISDMELAETLRNDLNADGVGWNVKIKATDTDDPYMYLPVKVKFNDFGPNIYLKSGQNKVKLDEDTVRRLDDIWIANVNLDITASDGVMNGKPYRTAYLRSMEVTQEVESSMDRFAEEAYPGEDEDEVPFN